MKILAISGSASPKGSNYLLLQAIQDLVGSKHQIEICDTLQDFPLFTPEKIKSGIPKSVQDFKLALCSAEAIVITTPEYTHNIPAALKNMLEWCTHSGEFNEKKVLPITFTPHAPRGKYAMESLCFSLKALNANVVAELPLYKTDVVFKNATILLPPDIKELILGAIELM